MKKILSLLFVAVVLAAGCKKNDRLDWSMTGQLTDKNGGTPLGGITVQLSAKVIKNNIYSASPVVLGTGVTAADGSYTVAFEKQNADEYVVETVSDKLFATTIRVSPTDMHAKKPYRLDISVFRKSGVEVHVKNQDPGAPTSDILRLFYKGPKLDCECCNGERMEFYGPADTTFACNVPAGQFYKYEYTIISNFGTSVVQKLDSVKCEPDQVMKVNVFY
ncbi:MAG: hypothetical protein V4616_14750 [Bacteroidota bacterium]